MRKQPRRPSPEKQAGLTPAEIKRQEKEFARELKAWEKDRAAFQAQIDRQYEKQLREFERLGIYQPKAQELTPYRKKRIRQATREYHEFLEGDYSFVALPDKKAVSQAASLDMKTTHKGVFVAREGHTRVKLTRRKGELYIDRSGKTKVGVSGHERRYVVERIPLATVDELTRERDRLIREARALGPLKDNERLAFKLTTYTKDGKMVEGYSRQVFDDIDKLIEEVEKYEKSIKWKLAQIFRSITIMKTASGPTWFREHPRKDTRFKKRKVNIKGRNV